MGERDIITFTTTDGVVHVPDGNGGWKVQSTSAST